MNPDTLQGWGVRPNDWQWGVNLQQELIPRVSLEVGYNRRWCRGHSRSPTTCCAVPSDYEKWTIIAPVDPRLPGRRRLSDHATRDDGRRPRARRENYITFETDFGPDRDQTTGTASMSR